MTIFDLLLIVLVLATVAGILGALIALFVHRRVLAARTITLIVAGWALYLGAGTTVALLTPQRILSLGEDNCFDEMCFAVTGYHRVPSTNSGKAFYVVDVRISNRSRSRAQREKGRKGVLVDRAGHVTEVSRLGMQSLSSLDGASYPGLDAEVAPGQNLKTKLAFELPLDVRDPGFALGSDLAINPARLVIGDEEHFLHRPTVVPLNEQRSEGLRRGSDESQR
jgi:hypothetical protein